MLGLNRTQSLLQAFIGVDVAKIVTVASNGVSESDQVVELLSIPDLSEVIRSDLKRHFFYDQYAVL